MFMAVNKIRQFGNRTIPTLKDKIPFTDIINDTTTGGTLKPLSAEQGKSLQGGLNQEVADRTQAIIDLKDGVAVDGNTLNKLNLKINQEASDRAAAIAQEVVDRDAAILVETTRAQAEEARIDATIISNNATLTSAINTEKLRAQGEESRIEGRLDSEIATRTSEIGILNGDSTVAGSVDQKISVEAAARTTADGVLQTNIDNEESRALAAEGVLTSNLATLTATVATNNTTITSALNTEITNRTSADTALSNRIYAIESGLVAGVMWKGAVADLAALDALVEGDLTSGWAYYVQSEKDVYVVLPDVNGDHIPSTWTTKSFLKIADFAELTGLVNAEKSRAIAVETTLSTSLSSEVTTRTTEIARVDSDIATEITNRTTADTALGNRIDAEESARIAADSALDTAYKAADTVLDGRITTEIANRIADVDSEEARATAAENALDSRVTIIEGDDTTVGSIAYAVKTETTRALAAEAANAGLISTETAARIAADSAESAARIAADTDLDARLDIIEGDKTVAGSVANARQLAQEYFDKWAPQAKLEGMGGTLTVVGDTITTVYVPMVDGVINGEVVVYAGDGDTEAVAVNVANISGNSITLDVVTSGEFDGKVCKVHYFYREGDQVGAGVGVAGENGAGF